MKKRYTFALNFGYAEDASLGFVPFTSSQRYADAKEALLDLAAFFKEHYVATLAPRLKKCCESARSKDPGAKFCPKCGKPLDPDGLDADGFMDWLRRLDGCSVDSYHGEVVPYDEGQRWQPGGLEGLESVRTVHVAEKVLAAAIGHSPDGRVTIESIFKDRTKSGGRSFSFW